MIWFGDREEGFIFNMGGDSRRVVRCIVFSFSFRRRIVGGLV